ARRTRFRISGLSGPKRSPTLGLSNSATIRSFSASGRAMNASTAERFFVFLDAIALPHPLAVAQALRLIQRPRMQDERRFVVVQYEDHLNPTTRGSRAGSEELLPVLLRKRPARVVDDVLDLLRRHPVPGHLLLVPLDPPESVHGRR